MFKYILQNGGDINWMAIFALLTFVSLFLISSVVIFARSKEYINHMSNLPLDEDSNLIEPEI